MHFVDRLYLVGILAAQKPTPAVIGDYGLHEEINAEKTRIYN